MSCRIEMDGPYISRRARRRAYALALLGWLLMCSASIAFLALLSTGGR